MRGRSESGMRAEQGFVFPGRRMELVRMENVNAGVRTNIGEEKSGEFGKSARSVFVEVDFGPSAVVLITGLFESTVSVFSASVSRGALKRPRSCV